MAGLVKSVNLVTPATNNLIKISVQLNRTSQTFVAVVTDYLGQHTELM